MTTAQVVETSVTVNNNSSIQDYVHPDDQTQPTFENTSCKVPWETSWFNFPKSPVFPRWSQGKHQDSWENKTNCFPRDLTLSVYYTRVVTNISSYRVNTTSRRGIKRLGIFLVLFFFYFPIKVAGGHSLSSRGKIPGPRLLMTTLLYRIKPLMKVCLSLRIVYLHNRKHEEWNCTNCSCFPRLWKIIKITNKSRHNIEKDRVEN